MNPLHSTDEPAPLSTTFPRYSIGSLLRTMAGLAFGYIVLLAYLHWRDDSGAADPDVQQLFGGLAGLSTLKHADRVEAYLIDKPSDLQNGTTGLLRYPIRKGPISVSKSDAKTLQRTLLDRKSYLWNMEKGCKPVYGVRLDFIRSDHHVSVLLCFECDILQNFLDDKVVGVEDFDGARPTIGRIVCSIFPDDPQIQSLLGKN